MASIIEGYNYDIFISYRQKDNKHDGWVTEFVNQLKGELESTFKEEVSVYFDINPHDGLLETHDVDESLKDKIKCLVFIPIISRTYCDPKSFAWEHEFKAFVEQVSKDQFGLKVKLPSGNVVSRVLPVRIYELDSVDKKLCESILGGAVRGVEFIYAESGVNRPLRSNEEKPHDNLNHTIYRNQINKVANAIKDVFTAIEQHEQKPDEVGKKVFEPVPILIQSNKIKYIFGSVTALALIILGLLFIPKLFKSEVQLEKSVAVLPFYNYSDDQSQEYMSDGLTAEIINHLCKIKSFDKVVSLSSVLTYKNTNKTLPQIASELKVNFILEGTYKKIGDQVRVTAQLIEPKNDKQLWQNDYNKPYTEIIEIQADIALQIADQVRAFLTSSEQQNIQKISTTNQEAYELLQKAIYIANTDTTSFSGMYNQSIELIKQAVKLDPNYADAFAYAGRFILGGANYAGGREMSSAGWDAMHYLKRALEIDPNNGFAHLGLAELNDWFIWDYEEAEKEYLTAIELLPNYAESFNRYGAFLVKMNCLDEAEFYLSKLESTFTNRYREIRRKILLGNQEEALKSLHEFLDLWKEEGYIWAGEAYLWLKEYDSALFYLESVKPSIDPEIIIPKFQSCLALVYQKTNNDSHARSIINQLIAESETTSAMSPDFYIGWYYSGIGKLDSAFYWLENAYKTRSPEMPWLKVDPIFNSLKNDDRYWDLYERTGHKAYDEYRSVLKN